MTVVYHFENKENDQYFHDITFDKMMLENEKTDEICSHLYMHEGYYFNPKMLKRHQVSSTIFYFILFSSKLNFEFLIDNSIDKQIEVVNEFLRRGKIAWETQYSWK